MPLAGSSAAIVFGVASLLVAGFSVSVSGAEGSEATPRDLELIDAAWRNDVVRAGELIEGGADVNARDDTVQSAYLIATSEGFLELLELTLENGADVGSLDWYDGTGLIRSAERGHWQVVGRLIEAGIEPDHVNRLGWTALHEAIILGDGSQDYVDTVRVLVAGGADVTLPTGAGDLPVDLARRAGQASVESTIRRAIDAEPAPDPERALFVAIRDGDADAAALAVRDGASVDALQADGVAAIDLATKMSRTEIARFLQALGATSTVDSTEATTQ